MSGKLPFNPPQLSQFMDACWVESYFTKDEVALILKAYENKVKSAAQVADEGLDMPDLRKSTVTFLEPDDAEYAPIIHKLAQLAIQVNQQRYAFDLSGIYEPLQIAQYDSNDFFDWHTDFSNGQASTRKLSLSVQLSEPSSYEGGDLQFKINTNEINAPKSLGTVVIFPSFIQHRVTPITSGSRKSLVAWITGPHFK
ncbi:2OG-Fe(II) oxygenase [Roseivirga pacifica]|uniref:2OG-Fe(II) oxygenase n=1 Tax=Roseivirga pacifica TaxID=1267423 RepID=UPI002095C154|nr:2OG-Fe(II) oxygenase [Roseivirga pacifica]MCO6360316.1 2OG-Fe(II) oxygenase [Roseivirga pacifica]MCO6367687.1 2OG-Fe(II) oxygenase [Roseivirga pacifica]MCO6369781.1 2OG-Fe(II) oxygenase [Roseivirga pacifica]MCO6375344.1 2OG-Fe(II) oxygenase [Roseivirga pacifica]MCO6380602.1 2OG-Fe(II) oxygenase [Roseivirga pacifica]